MSGKSVSAPRIAIKLGGAPSSSTGPSSRLVPPSTLGKRPRPRLLDADSGSEREDDWSSGKQESITLLGPGVDGLEHDGTTRHLSKPPLVIPRQPNRDWRSERDTRGKRRATQQDSPIDAALMADQDFEPGAQDNVLGWGLTISKRGPEEPGNAPAVTGTSQRRRRTDPPGPKAEGRGEEAVAEAQSIKTADEEALEALLDMREKADTRNLVIPRGANQGGSEDDELRRHIRDAPEASTLEEYEEMPVEEFGAALLRGMGWDGKPRGPRSKEVKRRPNQMGLGARSLQGQEDLGAWNQGGSAQRRPRLNDYKRMERERQDERYRDSYRQDRDRERQSSDRTSGPLRRGR